MPAVEVSVLAKNDAGYTFGTRLLSKMYLSRLRNYIADNWIKLRYVYSIRASDYQRSSSTTVKVIDFGRSELDRYGHEHFARDLDFLNARFGQEVVSRRLSSDDFRVFNSVSTEGDQLTGCCWLLSPIGRELWHDKCKICEGTGFGLGDFVSPEWRRQGIYRALQTARLQYAFDKMQLNELFFVVEARNTAANAADRKMGFRVKHVNILIKVFRRNVMSIEIGRNGVRAYWIYRNHRSTML